MTAAAGERSKARNCEAVPDAVAGGGHWQAGRLRTQFGESFMDNALLMDMLRRMTRIRLFEERLRKFYEYGVLRTGYE